MDSALKELILQGTPDEEVEILLKLVDPDKIPDLARVITQFGNIATVRAFRKDIPTIYNSPYVFSAKAARITGVNRHVESMEGMSSSFISPSDIRAFPGMPKGNKIIMGIIDWGIDFDHPAFRDKHGNTRIISIWDQSLPTTENSPTPFGYGKVFSRSQINHALKTSSPYATLGYHPAKADKINIGCHGTIVTDIACGSSAVEGVAPQAEIIFVHLATKHTSGTANLGDTVRILEAIDYCHRVAGAKPLSINLSIGTHGGNHTGTSLVEQGIDYFLELNKNRVICQSTGNYFTSETHASGIVFPGKSKIISFTTDPADLTSNEIEVWYSGRDKFKVGLKHEDYPNVFFNVIDTRTDIFLSGKLCGRIYHRSIEPNSSLNHIDIFLYPIAPSGKWILSLYGEVSVDGRFHAWIERDNSCSKCQSKFDKKYSDSSFTTGAICNGYNSIPVGAYNAHSKIFKIAHFSSKGPTLDGRPKPLLLAPGVDIIAARSASINERSNKGTYTRMSGTSMAAPYVAGAMALVMELIDKPADIHTLRYLLAGSTKEVEVNKEETDRIGSGIIDIPALIKNVLQFNSQKNAPVSDFFYKSEKEDITWTATKASNKNGTNVINKILHPYPQAAISLDELFDTLLSTKSSGLKKYFLSRLKVGAWPEVYVTSAQPGDILLQKNGQKSVVIPLTNLHLNRHLNHNEILIGLKK